MYSYIPSYSYEDMTLPALPSSYEGYMISGTSWINVGNMTFAPGAKLFLQSIPGDRLFTVNGGQLEFEGDNTITPLNVYGSPDSSMTISFDCESVSLNQCTINAGVKIGSDTNFSAAGTTFNAPKGLSLTLTGWDGTSTPAVLDNLADCRAAADSAVAYTIDGLGGRALTWDETRMQALLGHEAFTRVQVELIHLYSGDELTLAPGTSWVGSPIVVGEGAVLRCETGCRLEGVVLPPPYRGDDEEPVPVLVIEKGATLVADDLRVSGIVQVTPTSRIEGSIHFEKGSRISLVDWSGSTQQLVDTVLAGARWTSDEPLVVEIDGTAGVWDGMNYHGPYNAFSGDTQIVDLGSRFGTYRVPENGGYGNFSQEPTCVTFAKGVDVEIEDSLSAGNMVFEGDNVVRAAESHVAHLNAYEVVAHGTRFEIPVVNPENLRGENITFAAKVPFAINASIPDENLYTFSAWDGTATQLSGIVRSALSGISGYTITEKAPLLGVSVMALDADLTFNKANRSKYVPEGFSGLHFVDLFYSKHTVTVAAGETLDADNINLEAGGKLIIEEGARLTDSVEDDMDIYILADETSCGSLEMTGVDLNGAEIYGHGNLSLRNCWGKGEMFLSWSYQTGKVKVTGCDLSQVKLILEQPTMPGETSSTVFDFSGNYWGTSDLEAIKAMIGGYDESRIIIGEVLDSFGSAGGDKAPELTQLTHKVGKKDGDMTEITFSWAANNATSYELTVDGKVVYTGTSRSHKLELADGEHSYSVKAMGDGNRTATMQGTNFSLDSTAPETSVGEPVLTPVENGKTQVTFSWSEEAGVTYALKVDGKKKELADGTLGYTETLKDGAHEYSIIATDASGNSTETVHSLYLDTKEPKLKLKKPKYAQAADGQMEVTLKWSGESGATYRVMVDGQLVWEGLDSGCSFVYADGVHRYEVTATDAFGNVAVAAGELACDATAPVVSLNEVQASDISPMLNKKKGTVHFSWSGEAGATYTLMVDDKKVYSGKDMQCTVSLKDGWHSYSITAKDAAGNASEEVWGGSFEFDATAPTLIVDAVEMHDGTATLRWGADDEIRTYTLEILDGKTTIARYVGGEELFTTGALEAGRKYSYTLSAVDEAGNSSAVKKGTFSTPEDASDTVAPFPVTGLTYSLKAGKDGMTTASLSWQGEKGSTYTVLLDGDIAYVGKGARCKLKVEGWDEHEYSIIATDKAGNRSEALSGKIPYVDDWGGSSGGSRNPKIKLGKVKTAKAGEGLMNATLSWSGEDYMYYELRVDGGEAIEVYADAKGKASYTLRGLADGAHSYSISIPYMEPTLSAGGSFSYDASAPTVSLGSISGEAVVKKGVTRTKVSFSWSGETSATYTVTVDGKKLSAKKPGAGQSTFTATTKELAGGTHYYSILAKDKAGNVSLSSGSFTTDGSGHAVWDTAPAALALDHELGLSAGSTAAGADTVPDFSGTSLPGTEADKTELRLLA